MPVQCIPFTFHFIIIRKLSSVLWYSRLGVRKSIRPVKIEWWGDCVVICLEGGADCLMVQLIPLHPNTPSYLASFKSRLVLSFCYRLTQVVLENRPFNGCSSSSSVSFGRKHWHYVNSFALRYEVILAVIMVSISTYLCCVWYTSVNIAALTRWPRLFDCLVGGWHDCTLVIYASCSTLRGTLVVMVTHTWQELVNCWLLRCEVVAWDYATTFRVSRVMSERTIGQETVATAAQGAACVCGTATL